MKTREDYPVHDIEEFLLVCTDLRKAWDEKIGDRVDDPYCVYRYGKRLFIIEPMDMVSVAKFDSVRDAKDEFAVAKETLEYDQLTRSLEGRDIYE